MNGTTAGQILAGVCFVLSAGLALVLAGNASDYGLSPVAFHWLAVAAAMVGALGSLPHAAGGAARLYGKVRG